MGKCKTASHCVTDLDPISTTQMIGSQIAPVIFGFCRMSHQKREKTKATVPTKAMDGGKPIRAATVGRMQSSIRIRGQRSGVRKQRAESGGQKAKNKWKRAEIKPAHNP